MKDSQQSMNRQGVISPEDMSLSELLGSDAAGSESVSAPASENVHDRADDIDPGMSRLADMVARSSVETARTPSIAPPPFAGSPSSVPPPPAESKIPSVAPAPLPRSVAPAPISVVPAPRSVTPPPASVAPAPISMTPGPVSEFAPPKKKSRMGAILVVLVAVAGGVAGGYYFVTDQSEGAGEVDQSEQERLAKQIAEMRAKQNAEMGFGALAVGQQNSRPEPAAATERNEEVEKPAPVEEERPADPVEATPEADEPEEEAPAPAAKRGMKKAKSKAPKGKRKARVRAPVKQPAKKKVVKQRKSAPAPAAAPKKSRNDEELDSLLGANTSKRPEPKKKEPARQTSSLPRKPSKAMVNKVMGPISKKAKACAIYATGTVQVQVVVSKSGKVKSARALGSFAKTNAGKCAAMLAKRAKFPAFLDPTFTFKYPIRIK